LKNFFGSFEQESSLKSRRNLIRLDTFLRWRLKSLSLIKEVYEGE